MTTRAITNQAIQDPRYEPEKERQNISSLLQQRIQRLAHGPNADQLASAAPQVPFAGLDVGVRHDTARKPHLRRLSHPQRRLADTANLAGEPDLAEHGG